jgi:hypothetical protein
MKIKSVFVSVSFGLSLVFVLPGLAQTNAPPAEDEQADLAKKLQHPVNGEGALSLAAAVCSRRAVLEQEIRNPGC